MRRGETMWRARIINLLRAFDEPGRFLCRVLDRNNLIVLTVEHQGWHIEFLQILGLIGFGKRFDALVGIFEAGLHAPKPELIERTLGDFGPWPIGAIELYRQFLIEL